MPGIFVPAVIAIAALAFLGWTAFAADPTRGLTAAVAALIISCPWRSGWRPPRRSWWGPVAVQSWACSSSPWRCWSAPRTDHQDRPGQDRHLDEGSDALTEVVPADGVAEVESLRRACAVEADGEL
jgi:P-type Cu+ transporter